MVVETLAVGVDDGISVDVAVKLCDGAIDVVFTVFELIMTVGISDI